METQVEQMKVEARRKLIEQVVDNHGDYDGIHPKHLRNIPGIIIITIYGQVKGSTLSSLSPLSSTPIFLLVVVGGEV